MNMLTIRRFSKATMSKELTKKSLAEFTGTLFLVMVIVGSGIMGENISSNQLEILLAHSIATGAALTALIWIFMSTSGAHFNPAVTLVMYLKKEMSFNNFICFILCQICGGLVGAILANTMFDLNFIQFAETERRGLNIYLGEFIATFGLLMTILGTRNFDTPIVAPAVGLYITSAIWFTSSTSFANPAVTIARGISDTFTGIHPDFILVFVAFQILGAISAMFVMNFLQTEQT